MAVWQKWRGLTKMTGSDKNDEVWQKWRSDKNGGLTKMTWSDRRRLTKMTGSDKNGNNFYRIFSQIINKIKLWKKNDFFGWRQHGESLPGVVLWVIIFHPYIYHMTCICIFYQNSGSMLVPRGPFRWLVSIFFVPTVH